ncbi:hypothetical protein VTL71DRAFT_7599 [Oculimacula yallundae]|uniref:Uncharacterized protein n=1 Tax=Oculimacula yallundae TaxID=86028 RepID=A0ABR4BVS3_9HELO
MKLSSIILSLGAASLALSAALPAAEPESNVEFRAISEAAGPPSFATEGGIDIPRASDDMSLVPSAEAQWYYEAQCDGNRFIHPQHESEMWHAFDRYYGGDFRVQPFQTFCVKCRGGVIAYDNAASYYIDMTRNDFLRAYDCIRPYILSGKSKCWINSRSVGFYGGWHVGAVQEFPGYEGCIEGC